LIDEVKDYITGNPFSIITCGACQLAFTWPSPANMDVFYPASYRNFGKLTSGILRFFYSRRVNRWLATSPRSGSVLEIGCGAGLMLQRFKHAGWTVMGIERDDRLAAQAQQLGVDVTSAPIESLPQEPRFDLIVMFNVLEHIAAPLQLVQQCAMRLTPHGKLLLSMHNIDSWQARLMGGCWFHLDPPRHLIHFSPSTLGALLSTAGLAIESIRFSSLEHDPFGWIESILYRVTGEPNTITRFLMGMQRFNTRVAFALAAGALLAVPALAVSLVSWVCGKGSIMELTVRRKSGD
jgi:SAM-dependent methyltransferase